MKGVVRPVISGSKILLSVSRIGRDRGAGIVRQLTLIAILCLVAVVGATSATLASDADYVADGLRAWMQQYHVPTSSLAVMKDGALAGSYGYGGWQPEQKYRLG